MTEQKTVEPQYSVLLDAQKRVGIASFGIMSNFVWYDDPKRLTFLLSRYKFAAKMLAGYGRVLEVGCADAFGTRIVRQGVKSLTAVDFDPLFVANARANINPRWDFEVFVHDILKAPVAGIYDAVYALDVLEHIAPESEALFLGNICQSLTTNGVFLAGMPSLESQQYASPASLAGHVNCKSGEDLRKVMLEYFHNVFLFSMNDEVVHTGFSKMAQYLFVLCCSKR
ncbi:MAG: class I SAM-dependent methyltransferase [Proteobacteria bacterium]|nr:class I SAM-dependent methyltransferase [Pseudomonadota bacterium]